MKHVLLALATLGALAAPALADEALAKAKNCMACHATERKVLGPAYKDVAAKYADNANAVPSLAGKIIAGSKGVWGVVPMPANKISEDDAKKLATWIMSLK